MTIFLLSICVVSLFALFCLFWNTLNRLTRIGTQLRLILGEISSDSELVERKIKEMLMEKKYGDLDMVIQLSQHVQRMRR
jgi:hypothetical protein